MVAHGAATQDQQERQQDADALAAGQA